MNIPMLDLKREYEYMKNDIDAAIRKCLEHQQWILGPEVKELEENIAKYSGVQNCIAVASGTDALVLALRAWVIAKKGQQYFDRTDEIITTPFTFTATGDAILRAGATPVFVDIDSTTYNICPDKVMEYLKNSKKVVGIMPVHLYGQSCDMTKIMQIAKERNIFVIEDVAQAFGGKWQDKKLGSIGNAGAFSFFPSKNLGAFGDGGIVTTDDVQLADFVKMLLKHGGKDKYNVDHIGYNSRLDTLQAAIIMAKFKYIDEFTDRRRLIAEFYNKELQNVENIVTPKVLEGSYHVYHQYTIKVLNGKRDAKQKALKDKGISTMLYYPLPLHKMKVFENRMRTGDNLTESEKAAEEVLSLPVEPLLREEELGMVVKELKQNNV